MTFHLIHLSYPSSMKQRVCGQLGDPTSKMDNYPSTRARGVGRGHSRSLQTVVFGTAEPLHPRNFDSSPYFVVEADRVR